jgi:hypothetical protein
MARNALILVGADKGGVGKTTVTRTVIDYFLARDMAARVFDTEYPRGGLKRFHPDETQVVDLAAVPDQMLILDSLNRTNTTTIIDIRAGLLSPTLKMFRDVGFLEAVERAEAKLVLFHVLGPSLTSLHEIGDVAGYVTDARYFLVKNFINDARFFEWDPATVETFFANGRAAAGITIPKLNEMACEQVELASVPFLSFIANRDLNREAASYSFVLRGYVRHWLGHVWSEYDRVRLYEVPDS